MRMRTMHSLSYALTQFDCPITYVAPPDMNLTDEFKAELRQYNLNFKEAEHVEQAIAEADVILVEPVVQPDYTKSRDERKGDAGLTPANYKITRELLSTKAKSDAILLHCLPRMDEIPADVDITRWSRYWQEAFNGVVMRMALLALGFGRNGIEPPQAAGASFGVPAVDHSFVGGMMQTFLHGRDLIGDLDFSQRGSRDRPGCGLRSEAQARFE